MTGNEPTVVGPGKGERILLWVGFPLVSGALCWLLRAFSDWIAKLPWLFKVLRKPFKFVDELPEPGLSIGALVLGVVLGLLIAAIAHDKQVTVSVLDDEVIVKRGDSSRTIPREEIGGVFRDQGQLVLLGHEGQDLLRYTKDDADLPPADRLAQAFTTHGYPWLPDGRPEPA